MSLSIHIDLDDYGRKIGNFRGILGGVKNVCNVSAIIYFDLHSG